MQHRRDLATFGERHLAGQLHGVDRLVGLDGDVHVEVLGGLGRRHRGAVAGRLGGQQRPDGVHQLLAGEGLLEVAGRAVPLPGLRGGPAALQHPGHEDVGDALLLEHRPQLVAHHVGQEHVHHRHRGRRGPGDLLQAGPPLQRRDRLPPLRLDEAGQQVDQLGVVVDEEDDGRLIAGR